jgi:hypothetical protein
MLYLEHETFYGEGGFWYLTCHLTIAKRTLYVYLDTLISIANGKGLEPDNGPSCCHKPAWM